MIQNLQTPTVRHTQPWPYDTLTALALGAGQWALTPGVSLAHARSKEGWRRGNSSIELWALALDGAGAHQA